MPSVSSIGTALPEYRYSLEQVRQIGKTWLADYPDKLELFDRLLVSSRSGSRSFVLPADKLLSLNGLQHRGELFEQAAPALGAQAIETALRQCRVDSRGISSLLFTSCSCPSIPSIDALIVEQAALRRTVRRIPIYQHGCAGGVVGLQLAAKLSGEHETVALASVELCSLVFQPGNPRPEQLVGSAIFADGAACAIISPEETGLVFRDSESYLVPESRHLMGYDLLDDGFHLRLDRELPQVLARTAPERVRQFLSRNGLAVEEIAYWLFHPGGMKVLDFLQSAFALRPEQSRWSRDVLCSVGNLSSATILFVLRNFLEEKVASPGDNIVMMGVGPGLTLELILFSWEQ